MVAFVLSLISLGAIFINNLLGSILAIVAFIIAKKDSKEKYAYPAKIISIIVIIIAVITTIFQFIVLNDTYKKAEEIRKETQEKIEQTQQEYDDAINEFLQ